MIVNDRRIAAGQRTSWRSWWAVAILLLFSIFSFIDRQIIALMVGPLKHDLKLSDVEIGALQGLAFAIFYCIAGLPIGWLIDRFSRRLIIFVGVVIWSFASASSALATSFALLFLCRLFVGVGEASLQPASYSLLSDIFPPNRLATALGLFVAGASMGAGIAYGVGGGIVGAIASHEFVTLPLFGPMRPWQAAFVITGLPGIVCAALVFTVREPGRTASPVATAGTARTSFTGMLARRRLVLRTQFLAFPLMAACGYGIAAWTPAYLSRRFGWDPVAIGIALAVVHGVFGTLATMWGAMVGDRMYRRGVKDAYFRLHFWTTLAGAPICIAAYLVPSPWLCLCLVSVGWMVMISYGGTAVAVPQLIVPPDMRGRLSAVHVFFFALMGVGLGPLAVSAITQYGLKDEAQVGTAISILIAIVAIPVALLFRAGLKPLREALGDMPAQLSVPAAEDFAP